MLKENNNQYKKYISEDEEIRDGFLVTKNRKKVWNIQLGLFEQLKSICKKHNIKYYASGGTMLGAIRHKGYIPRDDDMDFMMFRQDYEKFLLISKKELPNNIKIYPYYHGFSILVNTSTTALGDYNRKARDNNFDGGIGIDIFPIDYASRYETINKLKNITLRIISMIIFSQKSHSFYIKTERNRLKKRKIFTANICKFVFKKINCLKLRQLYEKINKKIIFKSDKVYSSGAIGHYFPEDIYKKSINTNFENIEIPIPIGYKTYLKTIYGDYMKPVMDLSGGHNCRYSVNKSYKDIIKGFNKSKSNEENYKNCKDLFTL